MPNDLVILAAGQGTRFGGLKQLAPVGPHGESIMDYNVFDALTAGFGRVVLVIRKSIEDAMRRHVEDGFGRRIEVDFVHQDRPLGTGHAVLRARDAVGERFAVMNADDRYGRDAITRLGALLAPDLTVGRNRAPTWGLVGFPLDATLPPTGGVSRGAIEVEGDHLCSIDEIMGIERIANGFNDIDSIGADSIGATLVSMNRPIGATLVSMNRPIGATLVSMNLWALTDAVFPLLAARLEGFGSSMPGPGDELMLPRVIGDAVDRGAAVVRVVATTSRWCGLTAADDLEWVRARIGEAIDAGRYPRRLWS